MKKRLVARAEKMDVRDVFSGAGDVRVCCRSCIYWARERCRRRAPAPVAAVSSAEFEQNAAVRGWWPVTDCCDFCGEWAEVWLVPVLGEE